jgi:hypothetical protein
MAHITTELVEEILSDANLPDGHYDRGTFMVLQLRDMIDALKAKYYAEWEAARGGAA